MTIDVRSELLTDTSGMESLPTSREVAEQLRSEGWTVSERALRFPLQKVPGVAGEEASGPWFRGDSDRVAFTFRPIRPEEELALGCFSEVVLAGQEIDDNVAHFVKFERDNRTRVSSITLHTFESPEVDGYYSGSPNFPDKVLGAD